jgi:flagellar hook-associated protein FlgK
MGNITRQATIAQSALRVVHDQAVASRDQVSGVSLDDEAADLIRYQQAYQAAAKILQISSQLFDSVLQVR